MLRRFFGTTLSILALSPLIYACDSGGDGGTAPPPPPTVSVTFATAAPTLSQGDTMSVSATASNGGTVSYSSSNTAIATVTASGLVTGTGPGSSTITATAGSATATLEVTVTAFTPTVTIDQITQNGQAVDLDNVSGTIEVDVTATVPNAFSGEVVFFIDDLEVASAPVDGGGGQGLAAAAEGQSGPHPTALAAPRSRSLREKIPTAVAVTAVDVNAILNGPRNLDVYLRSQGAGITGLPLGTRGITTNNPLGVVIRPTDHTLVLVNGKRWIRPDGFEATVINPGGDPRIPAAVDIVAVDITKGGSSALYASDAVAGVINIVTRNDQAFGSAPNAMGGIEGEVEWQNPTLSFTDNTSLPVHLYNDELAGIGGITGARSWFDTEGPFYGAAPTWSFGSTNRWLGSNVDLTAFVQANGGDWTNGAIIDNGSGFDTCTDIVAGPDLQSLAAVLNSDALAETTGLNLRIGVRCRDFTSNFRNITIEEAFGIDRTAPTATLSTGSGLLSMYNINPTTGLQLGFGGVDNESGIDLNTLFIGGSRQDASGTTITVGTDNGSGGINAEQILLPVSGRYLPDYSQTGLHRYDFATTDFARNLSASAHIQVITDSEFPVVSKLTASSFETPLQPVTVSANITDNLSIKNWTVSAQYTSDLRLGMGRGLAWQQGGALVQSDNPNGAFPATGTVEVWNSGISGPQTPIAASGIWVGARDIADQGHEEWVPGTGGGSFVSFGAQGTDFFDYNLGGSIVDISPTGAGGAPTSIASTVQSFTAGGGTSRLTQVGLLAGVPEPGNPSIVAWWPISSFVSFPTTDRGGFFEQVANPVIDATSPAFGLEAGVYPVRAGGTDGQGNWLLSHTPQQIRVKHD